MGEALRVTLRLLAYRTHRQHQNTQQRGHGDVRVKKMPKFEYIKSELPVIGLKGVKITSGQLEQEKLSLD